MSEQQLSQICQIYPDVTDANLPLQILDKNIETKFSTFRTKEFKIQLERLNVSEELKKIKLGKRPMRLEQRLSCDKCDKIFPTRSKLWRHNYYVHVTKTHECSKCHKKFKSEGHLKETVGKIFNKFIYFFWWICKDRISRTKA